MQTHHIAIVSTIEPGTLSLNEITRVSAAIQKQIMRDFAPIWEVQATIDYFPTYEDIPPGYWPLIIVTEASGPGTHIDRNGQPIAYVEHGTTWSIIASHEVMEMLADPSGTRVIAGDSPTANPDRVDFLVEVCDPCQDVSCAYSVNGIPVSDFYTPSYFEPLYTSGSKYSFCGQLNGPRDVLPGGYLTWRSLTDGNWYQQKNDGKRCTVEKLGPIALGATGYRAAVDTLTNSKRQLSHAHDHPRIRQIHQTAQTGLQAARERAQALRDALREVTGRGT